MGGRRAYIVAGVLALGYMGVGARLFYLQVIKQGDYAVAAAKRQTEVVDLPARRGTIYDRQGRELAVSIDADSLYGVPANVDDPSGVARKLAPALGMDARLIRAKLTGGKGFVWIARKVDPDARGRLGITDDLRGEVGWRPEIRRYYPDKGLACQVLGFTGTDNKGLEGVEAAYEKFIGGTAGQAATEKDGSGKRVLAIENGYVAPKTGADITLTIDEKVQYIVEKELDELMARYNPVSATAIVMDPNTGEVLALASRPGFNPNDWQSTRPASWRDRAVTDTYEPGSTFKIVTASAALEENAVRPDDVIDCGDGEIEVGGRVIHSAHGEGGRLRFAEVIQKSNNVGTIKVALRLGRDRLYRYARAFGFGEKTGVDLPGEAPGMLRPAGRWSGVSIASVAIGQEVGVTALQMLCAVNTIANGGTYYEPYTVSSIRSADGTVVRGAEPKKLRRVVSRATARKMAEILSTVVEEGGTAVRADIRGYQVAGKTGTAQKYDPSIRRYSNEKYVSSFVGFVPADDPRISAIVVVNEPRGEHLGGLVAAPAFRNIALNTLTYMKAPTRLPEQTVLVERRP